ncbi:MAG TPA: Gfo/Idh/MocA family oxidoreductase [Chloroflexota bacterium]|nr:Gfo/Idh/MocA family oxidoreductase [Chloroflexota bacterium]
MANKQYGIGIVGLDHWYAGIGMADDCRNNPRARVVALAHRDEERLKAFASERDIPFATTDYAAIAARDEVDVVVTACPSAENVPLCLDVAKRGKPIISVKPFAMNLTEADRLVAAVREAGVLFYPFESLYRVAPSHRRYKQWVDEGRIGTPISITAIQRASLSGASMDWPGRRNDRTWWRDPSKVPGGGWLDHAIYQVDFLRWLLNDEVARVSGVAKTLAHPELPKELEDFGVALLEFRKGAVATIEVTWTAPASGGLNLLQIVGTEGQIVNDATITGKLSVSGNFDTPAESGWTTFTPAGRRGGGVLEHVLDCLEGTQQPIASVDDARTNLAVCLAFYEAARTGRAVTVGG